MDKVCWGIIGCGDVTEVKSGPAFNKVPHSRLMAVMRRNAQKAEDYARRHRVPAWYSDADRLINDPQVNAVYIATPPLFHEEYAMKALEAGKAVYVEKPMTVNVAAAQRLAEVVAKTGVPLSVAHYRRQQPLFLKVRSMIENGAIGKVRLAQLELFDAFASTLITKTEDNWRLNPKVSGGGLFYDLAPHQLDLMLYFFGKPKKVKGISLNNAGCYAADDITTCQIAFENGVVFNGTWCFTVQPDQKRDQCIIMGEKGSIRFKVFEHREIHCVFEGKESIISFEPLMHVQQPMIEKVVQYFRGEALNPCSVAEGVEVMEMMGRISNPAWAGQAKE